MNTLILKRFKVQFSSEFSTQSLFIPSPFPSRKGLASNLSSFPRKRTFKTLICCCGAAADSPSYAGWDVPQIGGDSALSGESNQLRKILNSLGIDDKRYVFVYLLGFVCALAISRVKVTSFIAFPACIVVFAVGFSTGFLNGGHLSLNSSKRREKDETVAIIIDKLKSSADMLSESDAMTINLKNDIGKGISHNQVTLADLESYIKTLDLVNLSVLNARKLVEDCMEGILPENQEFARNLNQKTGRRRKELRDGGFNIIQLFVGLFQETTTNLKPSNKTKDPGKRESIHGGVANIRQRNILGSALEEGSTNFEMTRNAENNNEDLLRYTSNNHAITEDAAENLISGAKRMRMVSENGSMSIGDLNASINAFSDSNGYANWNNRLHYIDNHKISLKTGYRVDQVERWVSHDAVLNYMDLRVNLKSMETEECFKQEQRFNSIHFDSTENSEKGAQKPERQETVISEEGSSSANQAPLNENNFGSSQSSKVSEDMLFNQYLTEANSLLKDAKKCITHRGSDARAENALYKSATLLSKAIDIRPMSLLAVGLLGNTYLVHGELKLRISRDLRALLARRDPITGVQWAQVSKSLSNKTSVKEDIASLLVNVCEECQALFVKAGRQYKLALSIDGNDMKALYNWGLALSFRAQLIADIGPSAAQDADKVFLAAIDKFDAMMSRSNSYAPDALFRWGVALQQRSRLRPWNSGEKMKLLKQARRLYEDALDMDSGNIQVQEALSSCISELNYWYN